MKRILSTIAAVILSLAVILSVSYFMASRLTPENKSYGLKWDSFAREEKNSIDVLVLGSSVAYCDIIPAVIYEQTGLSSYVVSGPELTPSIGYYFLREALKTQKPSAVAMEATCVFGKRYQNYSRINIGYMPWSFDRLAAVFRAAEPEERLGLIFPLYNYHTRWPDYTIEEIFSEKPEAEGDPLAGYTFLSEARPQGELTIRERFYTDKEVAFNVSYLKKIIALCEKEGIALELFIAPECRYVDPALIASLSSEYGVTTEITDYNADFGSLGLDLEKDFFDFLHLNAYGAKKFTALFAEDLVKKFSLSPGPNTDASLWERRAAYFNELLDSASKAAQDG